MQEAIKARGEERWYGLVGVPLGSRREAARFKGDERRYWLVGVPLGSR
jgi:hypothetical protein